MPPKKFADGEKILCYHGPMIYEAKCVRGQMKDKTMQYLVHYAGWNKSYDEWVPENRMLKYNDLNLCKQKEMEQQQGKGSKKRRGGPGLGDKQDKLKKGEVVESTRKRRRGDTALADDDGPSSKSGSSSSSTVMTINIPDALRKCLIDDSDLVNKQKQLVDLPHSCSVAQLLDEYTASIDSDPRNHGVASEVCCGIVEYFNVLLGTQLLYKFERPQYAELVGEDDDKPPSKVYGPQHLLRLFVKLGSTLAHTPMDDQSQEFLLRHINGLLKYISDNKDRYLSLEHYHAPAPEYHRRIS